MEICYHLRKYTKNQDHGQNEQMKESLQRHIFDLIVSNDHQNWFIIHEKQNGRP